MKLPGKIALMSTTLVVLGACEGLFAVLAMRTMTRSSQDISSNSLPAIYVLARADSIAKDARGKMRSHCISSDRKEMAQIQSDTMKLSASFDGEMASYRRFARSPEEARLQQEMMQTAAFEGSSYYRGNRISDEYPRVERRRRGGAPVTPAWASLWLPSESAIWRCDAPKPRARRASSLKNRCKGNR